MKRLLPVVELRDVRRVLAASDGSLVPVGEMAAAVSVTQSELVGDVISAFARETGIKLLRNGRGRVVSMRSEDTR